MADALLPPLASPLTTRANGSTASGESCHEACQVLLVQGLCNL